MNKLTADELKDPGYYWWLPSYLAGEPEKDENWVIVCWHPANPSRDRSGLFVGPLKAPCGDQP